MVLKTIKELHRLIHYLYKLGLAKPAIDDTSSNRSRMNSLILKLMKHPYLKNNL